MDEIEQFATLRPTDFEFTEADRRAIREQLFAPRPIGPIDHGEAGPRLERPTSSLPARRPDRRPARSRIVLVAAAAVAVTGLAVGALAIADTGTDHLQTGTGPDSPTTPADTPQPTPSTSTLSNGNGTDPSDIGVLPLALIDLPGWELISASDVSQPVGAVLVADGQGFDGPVLVAQVAPSGSDMSFGDEHEVTVNGQTGRLSGDADSRLLSWADASGTRLWLTGWQTDAATMIDAAAALDVTPQGRVEIPEPPTGFTAVAPAVAAAMGRYASYGFTGPSGQRAEVSLYAGGSYMQSQRIDPNEDEAITIDGDVGYLSDYGNGRYRVNIVRGFWDWEIDAEPFTSPEDFVDFVSRFETVDSDTWSQRLPAGIIGPRDRAQPITDILSDIPVPTGFDVEGLITRDSTLDRYQLAAQVTGAVACAWIDIWADARRAGNNLDADLASTALTSSHDWAILQEVADQGGWSDVLWEVADEVAATATGTGPAQAADGALGCSQVRT